MILTEFYKNVLALEEAAKNLYDKFYYVCDERIRDSIRKLSDEEEIHKALITDLLSKIEENNEILGGNVEALIKDQFEFIEEKISDLNFNREKDFFNFAFNIEKKTIDIYSGALESLDNTSYNYSTISKLLNDERGHMIFILKRIHELK